MPGTKPAPPPSAVDSLRSEERALVVVWADGQQHRYHFRWLRDNCRCPACHHPGNGQRLLDTAAIPADLQPDRVRLTADGLVEISWAAEPHTSRYPPAWLRAHRVPPPTAGRPQLWDAAAAPSLTKAQYTDLQTGGSALRDWLAQVATYGFALATGVPVRDGEVARVVELFGYVRETNYGRVFDVRSEITPNNLASTALALGAHGDNPYRDPQPTLQLLHCLSSSAVGGENTLVDAFYVAEHLRATAPALFDRLVRTPIRFRFQDAATDLTTTAPVIMLDPRGAIGAVRFNQRSTAPFDLAEEVMDAYYNAYQAFARLLEQPAFQIRFKLEPGDLFIVDNQRVLHGRTAFAGTGQRHLQGCYADRDGLRSRLAVLTHALGAAPEGVAP